MATYVWSGRCQDCFNKATRLLPVTNERLVQPWVGGAVLCIKCLKAREDDLALSKAPRPLGIPQDIKTASWIDLEPIVVEFVREKRTVSVELKLRTPTIPKPTLDDGGEVRIRIGDNKWWEPTDFLGGRPNSKFLEFMALSSSRLALHYRFGPLIRIPGWGT